MRRFLSLTAAFIMAFFLPLLVYAQEAINTATTVVTDPTSPVSNTDFLQLLIQSLGGLKGAGALAIAAAVVQILIKFLSTPWAGELFKNVSGAVKLLIVTGLSLVAGVLALMLPPTSLTLGAALVHSTTLTAAMVFANQLYKQFIEKPKEAAKT